MIILRYIGALAICCLIGVGCTEELLPYEQPNILFITVEGQAWEDLPGTMPFLTMPALERILNEGVVFRNHYANAPLDQPSRYTIVSGLYPHNHHLMEEGGNWLPDDAPVLMSELSDLGYYTLGVGKMNFRPWERKAGFDRKITAEGPGENASDTLKKDDYHAFLAEKGRSRYDYLSQLSDTKSPGVKTWPWDDGLSINAFIGQQACKAICSDDSLKTHPWFMWVSFSGPRYPWLPLAKSFRY
ncbi:MAG TPA: sulfatase-like hydrolase/transferase, partial [Prolixibacteraceae bacterium]|nr:sulfatase-like hydrolase/transferase [Prolixibacteraceae bacterium]